MPRISPKRKSPQIDMTAMVDITFLPLLFFLLSSKFKAPEPAHVDLPTTSLHLGTQNRASITLTVTKEGQVMTNQGLAVNLRNDQSQKTLSHWIQAAKIHHPRARFAIKGDHDTPYAYMERAISALQRNRINRFVLITQLETDPSLLH